MPADTGYMHKDICEIRRHKADNAIHYTIRPQAIHVVLVKAQTLNVKYKQTYTHTHTHTHAPTDTHTHTSPALMGASTLLTSTRMRGTALGHFCLAPSPHVQKLDNYRSKSQKPRLALSNPLNTLSESQPTEKATCDMLCRQRFGNKAAKCQQLP